MIFLLEFGYDNFCERLSSSQFRTVYNAFLGRPPLTKFIVIPHYSYLVLKMTGPNRVISIKGDLKRSYDCDGERCKTADALLTFVELQNLKKVMVECHGL
jgi:hypothetical protein